MFRTGDIQKNIEKLRIELHQIKYPDKPDSEILRSGNPEIFLPIIHYSLFNYSKYVADFLNQNNYNMFAKCDLDFINSAFKSLIKLFNYKPSLSTKQFFSEGFAEAKVILCSDIINLVKTKHSQLCKKAYSNRPPSIKPKPKYNTNQMPISQPIEEISNPPIIIAQNPPIKQKESPSPKFNQKFEEEPEDENQYENVPLPEEEIYSEHINNVNDNMEDYYNYNPHLQNSFDNKHRLENEEPIPIDNTNKIREHIEVYDSSQEFQPIDKKEFNTSNINPLNSNSMNYSNEKNNLNSSHPSIHNPGGSGIDFGTLVQVISSLSNSVSQMANKVENFKSNIEDRFNKLEAEISLIKNRQNILESKINNNNFNNNIIPGNSNNINKLTESNDQIFSFAVDEMSTNRDDNYVNENNNFCNTMQIKENEEPKNLYYNNTYSYGANNNKSPMMSKFKETDQLIENVEKKFRETKELLNKF